MGPVTVTFVPGTSDAPPRVAYAVGRKVGGAVVRNRLRRRLRAIVARSGRLWRPGDYLIAVRPEVAALSFDELRDHVTQAMDAAGRGR